MKKLFRSNTNRHMTGLCGGIGEFLNIDATIIRVLFVIFAIFSFGTMLLVYFISSIFVPSSPYSNTHYTNHYHY